MEPKDLRGRVQPEVSWIERGGGDHAGSVPLETRLKERDERHEEAVRHLSAGSAAALSPFQRLPQSSGCAPHHGRYLMEHSGSL